MDLIWQGLVEAITRIVTLDPETLAITWLSIQISATATALAVLVGVPLGMTLGLQRFRGRGVFVTVTNSGMALPPVVVGLFVSVMLWRSGPFGFLGIMYTPLAMVLAQFVIATPLVTAITLAAIGQLDPEFMIQLRALGASRWQALRALLVETRIPILAAVMAGFGAVISEVGASMMVGGNILGQTRVLTTATVLETSKGNFGLALALGMILLAVVLVINALLTTAQQRGSR